MYWALAAEVIAPMILVYRVRIDGEAIRMVTNPGACRSLLAAASARDGEL